MDKKKIRFNWIDVVIIIVVIALLGAAYLIRNKVFDKGNLETSPVRFVVEARNALPGFTDECKVGMDVYNSSTNAYIGKVVDVSSTPHVKNYSETVNTSIVYDGDDTSDVRIVIEGEGYSRGHDIIVGDYIVKVGNPFYFKSKGIAAITFVHSIDTMDVALDPLTNDGEGDITFTYKIVNIGVKQPGIDAIHIGDILYDDLTNAVLGEVIAKEVVPLKSTIDDFDDTQYFNQILTIKGKGIETERGYYLDGTYEIKVGAGNEGFTEVGFVFKTRYVRTSYWFYSLDKIER